MKLPCLVSILLLHFSALFKSFGGFVVAGAVLKAVLKALFKVVLKAVLKAAAVVAAKMAHSANDPN